MADEHHNDAVWRERARKLSRRIVDIRPAENAVPVMVLGLGRERFGIELSDVREVLPPVRATPVPGASTAFAGVINVHGEIRPVIDLGRLLHMEKVPNGAAVRVILLHKGGREVGLQVDSVEQIRRVGAEDLLERVNGCGEPVNSRYIRGSTGDLLMLLNTEALFEELSTGVTP